MFLGILVREVSGLPLFLILGKIVAAGRLLLRCRANVLLLREFGVFGSVGTSKSSDLLGFPGVIDAYFCNGELSVVIEAPTLGRCGVACRSATLLRGILVGVTFGLSLFFLGMLFNVRLPFSGSVGESGLCGSFKCTTGFRDFGASPDVPFNMALRLRKLGVEGDMASELGISVPLARVAVRVGVGDSTVGKLRLARLCRLTLSGAGVIEYLWPS